MDLSTRTEHLLTRVLKVTLDPEAAASHKDLDLVVVEGTAGPLRVDIVIFGVSRETSFVCVRRSFCTGYLENSEDFKKNRETIRKIFSLSRWQKMQQYWFEIVDKNRMILGFPIIVLNTTCFPSITICYIE